MKQRQCKCVLLLRVPLSALLSCLSLKPTGSIRQGSRFSGNIVRIHLFAPWVTVLHSQDALSRNSLATSCPAQ
jgi:hypothetical protein